MIETFITSFKLENAYKTNSMIYSIKGLPIIKKILPDSLYKSKDLKLVFSIISVLRTIIGTFLGKFLYVLLMIFFMTLVYETNNANTFLHIFTFLTLLGGVINTHMFTPSQDKYYAIVLMNMDAKNYAISDFYYVMLKNIISFMPFTIILGTMLKVPLLLCFLMPIFVVMVKMIFINYNINRFKKTKNANEETLLTRLAVIITLALLGVSYAMPLLEITINQTIFIGVFILISILGIASLININKFSDYKKMYKQILTIDNLYEIESKKNNKSLKENAKEQIEYDSEFVSDKTGFAYFHDLFVKRHSKILTKAVKKQAIIIWAVLLIVVIAIKLYPEMAKNINNMMLTYLPYFVFVMYLLNRGTTVTQAMFMNCDHSMLTYRIYRAPKVVLGIFKQRLKTLIKINLLPAVIIALGLPLLLYITGGTDNILNYIVLFTSIISMSIFFSVHYLVMYYLLQPYNVATEIKNGIYGLVQGFTYIICYFMTEIKLPTIPFGIVITTFSILYCLISLILVYKLAPKTFKLRV